MKYIRTATSLVFLAACGLSAQAQKMQIGISLIGNAGIYQHGRSFYNNQDVSGRSVFGGGLQLPLRLNLSEKLGFQTGLGAQIKGYEVSQKLTAPGVSGEANRGVQFMSLELPLVLTYSTGKKSWRPEFGAGVIASYNTPQGHSYGYGVSGVQSPVTFSVIVPEHNNSATFSPDLYGSVSIVRYKESQRQYQITLAYQHGLFATSRADFRTEINTPTTDHETHIFLRPALATVNLSITFWPKFLAFGSGKTSSETETK